MRYSSESKIYRSYNRQYGLHLPTTFTLIDHDVTTMTVTVTTRMTFPDERFQVAERRMKYRYVSRINVAIMQIPEKSQ